MNDDIGTPDKKAWETPELIVLLRRKPEETVLAACKFTNVGPAGPGFSFCTLIFCNAISAS